MAFVDSKLTCGISQRRRRNRRDRLTKPDAPDILKLQPLFWKRKIAVKASPIYLPDDLSTLRVVLRVEADIICPSSLQFEDEKISRVILLVRDNNYHLSLLGIHLH